jgi:hypothetical protein
MGNQHGKQPVSNDPFVESRRLSDRNDYRKRIRDMEEWIESQKGAMNPVSKIEYEKAQKAKNGPNSRKERPKRHLVNA